MTNNRLNIGIFTCHIDNDYATEVCKGAEYAAKELDCNLIVFPGMFLNASFYDPANQLYDYQYNSTMHILSVWTHLSSPSELYHLCYRRRT